MGEWVLSKAFLLGHETEAVLENDQRCCHVAEKLALVLVPASVFVTALGSVLVTALESAVVWDEVSALESVPIYLQTID